MNFGIDTGNITGEQVEEDFNGLRSLFEFADNHPGFVSRNLPDIGKALEKTRGVFDMVEQITMGWERRESQENQLHLAGPTEIAALRSRIFAFAVRFCATIGSVTTYEDDHPLETTYQIVIDVEDEDDIEDIQELVDQENLPEYDNVVVLVR